MYQHWLIKWITKHSKPCLRFQLHAKVDALDAMTLDSLAFWKKNPKMQTIPYTFDSCLYKKKQSKKWNTKKWEKKLRNPSEKSRISYVSFSRIFFRFREIPHRLSRLHTVHWQTRATEAATEAAGQGTILRKFGEVWWVPHAGGNISWRSQAKKEVTVPCTIFFFNGHNIIPSWSYCGFIHLRWWIGATDRSSGQALVPSFLKMIWTTSVLCLCALAGKRCQYHKKTERR